MLMPQNPYLVRQYDIKCRRVNILLHFNIVCVFIRLCIAKYAYKIYMHILFGHFQNNVKTGYFLEITACSPVEKSVECVYNYLYVMQISVDSVDRFPSKMKFH